MWKKQQQQRTERRQEDNDQTVASINRSKAIIECQTSKDHRERNQGITKIFRVQ